MLIDGIVASQVSGLTLPGAGNGDVIIDNSGAYIRTKRGERIAWTVAEETPNPFYWSDTRRDTNYFTRPTSHQIVYTRSNLQPTAFNAWALGDTNLKGLYQNDLVYLEFSFQSLALPPTESIFPSITFGVTDRDFESIGYFNDDTVNFLSEPKWGPVAIDADSDYNASVRVEPFTDSPGETYSADISGGYVIAPDVFISFSNFFSLNISTDNVLRLAVDLENGFVASGWILDNGIQVWYDSDSVGDGTGVPNFRDLGSSRPPNPVAGWSSLTEFYPAFTVADFDGSKPTESFSINIHGSDENPFVGTVPTGFNIPA